MERIITVDKAKCVHCGLCINDCFVSCLEFDSEKIPKYAESGNERCAACQHCMAVCPAGALSFGGVNPADLEEAGYGNSEELLKLIKSRRSIRKYRNESIPTEKLEKICMRQQSVWELCGMIWL